MSVRDERGVRRHVCAAAGLAPRLHLLFGPRLPGMPRSCVRIDCRVRRRRIVDEPGLIRLASARTCPSRPSAACLAALDAVLASVATAFLKPGPFVALVDFCDEVAALTDAAASAATSSAATKTAAVANLRRFTDSSPLDSNFFSPPPQTALQQTSLPSRPSPPFRTSSFPPIRTCPAGSTSGADTP